MRGIFLLLVLFLVFTDSAEAECWVPRWRFLWDVQTDAQMISDGSACRMVATRVFRTSEVHSIAVASPPKHGSASASGLTVNYRPSSGFKGEDSFVFALSGRRNGIATHTTVRVAVTVK